MIRVPFWARCSRPHRPGSTAASASPQYNGRSEFIGPAPIAQVRLFNSHPTGRLNARERLDAIMGRGGLVDCGNAQNCVEACPKVIPLTEAFGELGRQTTILWLQQLFQK